MLRCDGCGASQDIGSAKFCRQCGGRLTVGSNDRNCQGCDRVLHAEVIFCQHCGTEAEPEAPSLNTPDALPEQEVSGLVKRTALAATPPQDDEVPVLSADEEPLLSLPLPALVPERPSLEPLPNVRPERRGAVAIAAAGVVAFLGALALTSGPERTTEEASEPARPEGNPPSGALAQYKLPTSIFGLELGPESPFVPGTDVTEFVPVPRVGHWWVEANPRSIAQVKFVESVVPSRVAVVVGTLARHPINEDKIAILRLVEYRWMVVDGARVWAASASSDVNQRMVPHSAPIVFVPSRPCRPPLDDWWEKREVVPEAIGSLTVAGTRYDRTLRVRRTNWKDGKPYTTQSWWASGVGEVASHQDGRFVTLRIASGEYDGVDIILAVDEVGPYIPRSGDKGLGTRLIREAMRRASEREQEPEDPIGLIANVNDALTDDELASENALERPQEGRTNALALDEARLLAGNDTEREARQFVDDYIEARADGSGEEIISLYAARVDFHDEGVIGHGHVANNKRRYFARWPRADMKLLGAVEIEQTTSGVKVSFDCSFVAEGPSGKTSKGRFRNTWVLTGGGSGLHIVSEKQEPL